MLEGLVFRSTLNHQIGPMIHHLKVEVKFEQEIQQKSMCWNFMANLFCVSVLFTYLYLISQLKIEVPYESLASLFQKENGQLCPVSVNPFFLSIFIILIVKDPCNSI